MNSGNLGDVPSESRQFIEFISSLSSSNVPVEVIRKAQACLMDCVGVGIFGAGQPWSQMLAANTLAESTRGQCTLLGREEALAPAPAALVNGTAIHGFELDDLIAEAGAHPGAVAVPAALAAAQHTNASGLRLLLGIVAGYETVARLGMTLGSEPSLRGFHLTGVVGPIAAAVTAGVTTGMAPETLLTAVGLACSASSGIKSFARGDGGVVKRMHAGRSAEAGVRMCQLAARGFAGPRTAIDGKFGLLEVFAGNSAHREELTADLGKRWAVDDIWVKVFPVCGQIQGIVQLLLQLRGSQPLPPAAVKAIRVGVCRYATINNGNAAPVDTMGAQYSIPYCAAVAAAGDPSDPASFGAESIASSDLRDLANRVEIYVDESADASYPKHFASRVELHLTNGEKRERAVVDPHGTPADPCTEAERIRKFSVLAGKAMSPGAVARLLDVMNGLAKLESVQPLSAALVEH